MSFLSYLVWKPFINRVWSLKIGKPTNFNLSILLTNIDYSNHFWSLDMVAIGPVQLRVTWPISCQNCQRLRDHLRNSGLPNVRFWILNSGISWCHLNNEKILYASVKKHRWTARVFHTNRDNLAKKKKKKKRKKKKKEEQEEVSIFAFLLFE